MVLTPRQREELKSAVAAFLKEIGANEARKVFIEESDVKNVSFFEFVKFKVLILENFRGRKFFTWNIVFPYY